MSGKNRIPAFWSISLIGWAIVSLILFLSRWLLHGNPLPAFGITIVLEATAIFLFWVLLSIYQRVPPNRRFSIQIAVKVVLLCLVATSIQSSLAVFVVESAGWHHPSWTPLETVLLRFLLYWMLFIGWSLSYFWLRAEQDVEIEESRAAAALAEAQRLELQFLRAQLDPHFLFNTLNGIASVVTAEPQKALAMIRELADYLRYLLDHRHDSLVSLAEETEALENYLRIEKARFGQKLTTTVTVESAAKNLQVPFFILPPLAENAIKHSFQNSLPPWNLDFTASVRESTLVLSMRNNGHMGADIQGHGIGFETLKRRLELHYPERHSFKILETEDCVIVEITLEGEPWFA